MSDQQKQQKPVKMFAISQPLLQEVFNCLTDGSYKNKTFKEINDLLMTLQKMPEIIQKDNESDPFENGKKKEEKTKKNEIKV